MWSLILIPMVLVLHDYLKAPIDRMYFNNPRRIMVGMQNTVVDILSVVSTPEIPGLWLIKAHYDKIRREFLEVSSVVERHLFHELDPWFDKNDGYYFYKVEDFPILKSLVDQIPSIHKETALFAVIDGPMTIAPHRAETNLLLRYHLTIEGGGDCTLYTGRGPHKHREGEDFLFDHAKYHELVKTGNGRRVVLILDVHRCF
jgi:hypothetical protein|tara:strand:- start:599 stop:1201 length:603 start_codon:yes stop_codon:yes gene_type:complete